MDDRWQGWRELPSPGPAAAGGAWLELSHRLRPGLRSIAYFPEPRFARLMSMPADPLNLTEMRMVCHFGTHVDAPCHFIADGPALHEIPLERLYGPGVVWRIEVEPHGVVEAEMLAAMSPELRAGDIVLLDTGWAAHVGTERYDDHPSLSLGAADWLVERGAKLLAVDFPTPDIAVNRRGPGFDWPVHHRLLGRGVLIAENLTNLRPLAGRRVEAMFLALSIEGADGAPARVVARPAPDDRAP
jgi:kynurenine formamidase